MSPEQVQSFIALGLGFALAGLLATVYQSVMERPPSFHLLSNGPAVVSFAAIPLLMFTAPFIIMRNTLRGRRLERRHFSFVMLSTVIAGLWSLMSGTVVVMGLRAMGL